MSDYTFANKASENVKVCIYHVNDPGWVPVEGGVVFLDPNDKGKAWSRAPGEKATQFQIKYFHPELFDRNLASRNDVPLSKTVTLVKSGDGYSIDVA